MDNLKLFLSSPVNSLYRENILRHRFLYDIKIAAARRGYCLKAYQSDIDIYGDDVILEDGDFRKPVQLKSIFKGATTQAWAIHKELLRPSLEIAKLINYDYEHQMVGQGGGLVIQEVDFKNDLEVNYYYTDFFVLALFNECIIKRSDKKIMSALLRVALRHSEGKGSEKIKISKGMLVKVKSIECLLAFLGLHSNISSDWINHLIKLLKKEKKGIPEVVLKRLIVQEVDKLCYDNFYRY